MRCCIYDKSPCSPSQHADIFRRLHASSDKVHILLMGEKKEVVFLLAWKAFRCCADRRSRSAHIDQSERKRERLQSQSSAGNHNIIAVLDRCIFFSLLLSAGLFLRAEVFRIFFLSSIAECNLNQETVLWTDSQASYLGDLVCITQTTLP